MKMLVILLKVVFFLPKSKCFYFFLTQRHQDLISLSCHVVPRLITCARDKNICQGFGHLTCVHTEIRVQNNFLVNGGYDLLF